MVDVAEIESVKDHMRFGIDINTVEKHHFPVEDHFFPGVTSQGEFSAPVAPGTETDPFVVNSAPHHNSITGSSFPESGIDGVEGGFQSAGVVFFSRRGNIDDAFGRRLGTGGETLYI